MKMYSFIITIIFALLVQAQDLYQLYTDIMPAEAQAQEPDKTLKSFRVHTLDSYQIFPDFAEVKKANLVNFSGTKQIQGTIKYVEVIKKTYKYDVENQNGKYIFHVKIYFRFATPSDIQSFTQKLIEAESIWNNSRYKFNFDYQFKFHLVQDAQTAHYKVNVLNSTRGPYDTNWGRDWDAITVAHELGHMLGLGDEYQTVTSQSDCLASSLMCNSYRGKLMKHHFYFVLRRLVK